MCTQDKKSRLLLQSSSIVPEKRTDGKEKAVKVRFTPEQLNGLTRGNRILILRMQRASLHYDVLWSVFYLLFVVVPWREK
jgi:hypothetical protein